MLDLIHLARIQLDLGRCRLDVGGVYARHPGRSERRQPPPPNNRVLPSLIYPGGGGGGVLGAKSTREIWGPNPPGGGVWGPNPPGGSGDLI